jgi:hypothetical protein
MTTTAYHFVGDTLRDGRPVPPNGTWLEHTGPIRWCQSGLYFARDPFDALQNAPGPILCRVRVEGIEREETGGLGAKGVCRRRRIIERVDATEMLRYFARMQALSVVHLWDAPDVVLDYLMTGDESLRIEAEKAEAAAEAEAAASAASASASAWAEAAASAAWASVSAMTAEAAAEAEASAASAWAWASTASAANAKGSHKFFGLLVSELEWS